MTAGAQRYLDFKDMQGGSLGGRLVQTRVALPL